jgi:hypothetical protein
VIKIGSKVICVAQVASNGTATCELDAKSLHAGKYEVTATYEGNNFYIGSTSESERLWIF